MRKVNGVMPNYITSKLMNKPGCCQISCFSALGCGLWFWLTMVAQCLSYKKISVACCIMPGR